MNPTIEMILGRRAVRAYEAKPIPRDVMEEIIRAGNAAPSGCNAQAWRFVAVEDAESRERLAALALPRYKKWMAGASDGLKEMREEIDSVVKDPVYYSAPSIVFVIGSGMTADLDSPMVCQNMMLAARSLGVGSCWVYFGQLVLDDKDVRAALELREDEKVYGPILFGYPKDGFPDSPPKKEATVKWI
ncbi:MAG: nitroreductase family protein [Candidatus Omnitrophota bacterium]